MIREFKRRQFGKFILETGGLDLFELAIPIPWWRYLVISVFFAWTDWRNWQEECVIGVEVSPNKVSIYVLFFLASLRFYFGGKVATVEPEGA